MFPGPGQCPEGLASERQVPSSEANHQTQGNLLTTSPDPWSCEGQLSLTCVTVRGKKIAHERVEGAR